MHVHDLGGNAFEVLAWGPGASWIMDHAPAMLGARDDLAGWEPDRHPVVAEAARRLAGLRIVASGAVLEAVVPSVLEQKIQSAEAHEIYRRMVWAWGERAPGPDGPRLPPSPRTLAGQPYHAYHRFGLERTRADVIRRLAARAPRVEEAASVGRSRLEAFPGVGRWTSAEVAIVAWGDADAVSVGDFHLARVVVYALTGRDGGDDDAMLELLEPFRPHRGRAARLIENWTERPKRRAPRARIRDFRRF